MQRVIKGHQIVVYGATSTCKNWGSMIRGFMDPVHERWSMDPVHGPGPQGGSMFCTFPYY